MVRSAMGAGRGFSGLIGDRMDSLRSGNLGASLGLRSFSLSSGGMMASSGGDGPVATSSQGMGRPNGAPAMGLTLWGRAFGQTLSTGGAAPGRSPPAAEAPSLAAILRSCPA